VYSKWPKLMPMSGITSAWLLYEMAMATKTQPGAGVPQWPSRLCDDWPVGSLVMRASGK
jgi:hypothetical protein